MIWKFALRNCKKLFLNQTEEYGCRVSEKIFGAVRNYREKKGLNEELRDLQQINQIKEFVEVRYAASETKRTAYSVLV